MEKFISMAKIVSVVIITIFLQVVISNNFEIFGVTPNLILVTIVIISMWNKTAVNITIACIMGILTDLIFHLKICESFIAYLIIAVCISFMSKKYRRNSKTAIIYLTIMATCIFTGFKVISYFIDNNVIINIFILFKQVVIEMLLNISISYILYKVFEKNMNYRELNDIYR